jgi:hypothetical protein
MASSDEPPMTFIGNIQIPLRYSSSSVGHGLLRLAGVVENSHVIKLNSRCFKHAEDSFGVEAICLPTKAS